MTRTTRRSVLAALGVGLATAGCVANPGGDSGESTTGRTTATTGGRTAETTSSDGTTPEAETATDEAETTTEEDSTTTDDWIGRASKSPDPDHQITLRNEAAEARAIRVRVVREATGETVFEATRDVSPGSEVVAYNLRHADPEGVEPFEVCGELADSSSRDCVTIDTNECYGDAHVTAFDDGSLGIVYAIC